MFSTLYSGVCGNPADPLKSGSGLRECALINPQESFSQGLACLRRGEIEGAIEGFDRVLLADPKAVDVLLLRGHALHVSQRFAEALRDYDQALTLSPELAIAHHQRGLALVELGQPQAALASFDQALQRAPDLADAHQGRGIALTRLHQPEQAAAAFERCLTLSANRPDVAGLALHAHLQQADWSRVGPLSTAVIAANERGESSDEPFAFLGVIDSAAAQLRCARRYIEVHYPPRQPPVWNGEVYRHDRIRVGYLSADFGEHPVSYLLAGVIERHDRRQFEILGLPLREPATHGYGKRMRAALDRHLPVGEGTDAQIAQRIREAEIDILVDLMGFTKGARLGVLAYRAAPVQVSYIGYPGTMGAPYYDYLLADPYVVPPEQREHYSEALAYLPDCFQANDASRALPAASSRTASGLPEGGLVFCCFNASYKITPRLFATWCKLLNETPNSVLWLLGERLSIRNNLLREARGHGVDPDRLVFAERADYETHLARLQVADLFLDTLPFNAGASASDALWAGVPVLTCSGESFAARMAGSLLQAMGLPELICGNLADYTRAALELAHDPSRLRRLRERLQADRATSRLFDTTRFCANLERAYTEMQDRARHGEKPESFVVKPG